MSVPNQKFWPKIPSEISQKNKNYYNGVSDRNQLPFSGVLQYSKRKQRGRQRFDGG